jgi:uncharacterized glyoxalase superfamily protein PhnB
MPAGNGVLQSLLWRRSDSRQGEGFSNKGTHASSPASGGTLQELKALFERLSEGAEVTDPLEEEFFGTYGALNDKFGVRWMFQTDKNA